ncbi:NGG1p interacting factor NIF3 [Patescibacteria group bacterium]|nr:NGG1p interacting factor NIF3 [Patescibacteria group bacterium]MBU2259236.1 NGG1p interacting factor NIF3 [Patescibacteria group bacterium]
MKLQKLFTRLIEHGMSVDPRPIKEIERLLKNEKDRQSKLSGKEKEYADTERLWNPYADTRIVHGKGDEEIKTIIVGIDVDTGDLMLVDHLRRNGKKIDAVMTHHPEARALADLDKVMSMQIDMLEIVGVPVNRAEALLRPRMEKIWRAVHSDNMFRTERAAEYLDLTLFNCHTPADNHVYQFIEKTVCKKRKYHDLGEIINALLDIPEYQIYAKKGNPPIIATGKKNNRPGKVVATEFTGGTNGPEEFIEEQARAGVGTILTMHVTEKSFEKAKEHHVNIIQCSHIASDNIGLNLILDKIAKEEKQLKVMEFSGFNRVKRK